MQKMKKVLALLLAMSMLTGMLGTAAFAAEEVDAQEEQTVETCAQCGKAAHEGECEPEINEGEETVVVANAQEDKEDAETSESESTEDDEPDEDYGVSLLAEDDGVEVQADEDKWTAAEITISTLEELKAFAAQVNAGKTFNGQTVTLGGDIDLENQEWTPIGTKDHPFQGIFDGGGNTVSNLTVNGEDFAGLFGRVVNGAKTAIVKNVTIRNAVVSGGQCVGALAGSAYTGNVENCHVTGNIQITGNYDVGGLTGYGYAKLTDCSVVGDDGSTVTGIYVEEDREGDNVGGLIGFLAEGSTAMTGCSVENLTVTGTRKVGGLVGSTYANRNLISCSAKNMTVGTNATGEYADDNKKTMGVGGLIGLFNNTNTTDYKDGAMSGCSVENITLINKNGVAAKMCYVSGGTRISEDFDEPIMTFTNVTISGANTGSNVTANSPAFSGEHAVETEDTVAQVGGQYFDSLQAAIAAAQDNDIVTLLADVTLTDRVSIKTSLTIKGGKADGSKPVITLTNSGNNRDQGFILGQTGNYKVTFEGLHMVAGTTGQMFIYQDGDSVSHEITVNNCEFTMADGVTTSGSVITSCNEKGHENWTGKVIFTNNTVDLLTGSMLPGLGNGSIVTGNTFIMQNDRITSRTGIMSLAPVTATATITGNTFRGANRVLAIDDSTKITPAGLTYKNNAFIDCLWAFEVDSGAGQTGYDLAENYYEYNGTVGEARTEDGAKKTGGLDHFDEAIAADTDSVAVTSYYAQRSEDGTLSDLQISSNVVAQVGDRYFTSLQAAIAAAEDGDTVTLLADAELAESFAIEKTVTWDLGGNTLNITAPNGFEVRNQGDLTIKNGAVEAQHTASGTAAVIAINTGSSVTLDSVTFNTSGAALYPRGDAAKVSVVNSEINAPRSYAVATNASTVDNYNVIIELKDSTLTGNTPVMINVPGRLTIDNCDITGKMQGVITRGGTADIKGSTIVLNYPDDDAEAMAHYFDNRNWDGGNTVNLAAITIGNKHATSYQYPSNVTITNSTVKVEGENGEWFPCVYVWAMEEEGKGVTLAMAGNTLTGGTDPQIVYGNENAEVETVTLELDRETAQLTVGYRRTTVTLTATTNVENAEITWESSDESVATVENGLVTPVGAGTATITATVNGLTVACTVTVTRTYAPAPVEPTTPPVTTTPDPAEEEEEEDLKENDTPLVVRPFLFEDIKENDWFRADVKTMFDRGLIGGMTETTFAPQVASTRAMVATLLYRMAGEPSVDGLDVTVTDVKDTAWYHDAAVWAYANGIFVGDQDGSFRGNEAITREQLVVVLNRYAAANGVKLIGSADLESFVDADSVSKWALEDMKWAVSAGLIKGRGDQLAAKETANRAELVTLLVRLEALLNSLNDEAAG